ncbi:unnamed protein product [Chilo suppressalis]|uniref:C2H2-type domain-containing protein n=1 Tax=Chilo suppressalis TaxID=168631 RepID=A0ABN8BBU4_CHISP|nr:unnamed protein product [Chilo suppressalis]
MNMKVTEGMNYEVRSNIQNLKQKLTNIFKLTKFCGICLDDDNNFWEIDTEFNIAVDQQTQKLLLKDIIKYILNSAGDQVLASCHICSNCTEKSIQAYLFIYNAKNVSQTIHKCVNELYSKTVDVDDQIKQIDTGYENTNVVIVLEQDYEMCQYTDIGTEIKETPNLINEDKDLITILNENSNQNGLENFETDETIQKEKVVVETIQPTIADINCVAEEEDFMKEVQTHKEILSEKNHFDNTKNIIDISNLTMSSQLSNENIDDKNCIEIMFVDEELNIHMPEYHSDLEDNRKDSIVISAPIKKKRLAIPSLTYKCKKCKEIIPSYKGWKEHEKICQKLQVSNKHTFRCKMCNELFISQSKLLKHYKTHSRVRCKVCQFIVPQEDLTEHMKINHEDYIHPCKLCKYFAFNADALKAHMKKNHSGSKCALCYKNVSEADLKLHKCRFNCLECLDNVCIHYKYLVSFRDQILNNFTKIKCVDCDYICTRREALLSHANREHLDHHPFTCAHCSQQFYSRTILRHHLNQFHKESNICEYCDQEFSTTSTLNNHKETCQNIQRHHKCDQCISSFETLVELANHVKLRHAGGSSNCNLCKKQYLSNTKLQEHIFRVHSGLQMKRKRSILVCPICELKCDSKKQLLDHIKIHGPNSRLPCKDCNEDFDSIKKLHAHMRIHYDDVIQCMECKKVLTATFFPHHMVYCKPGRDDKDVYTCETCGKTYNSEIQLKIHHKTHMEKIPCPICQKPTKPVYMKNHIKFMHVQPRKSKKVPKTKSKYYIKCDWCEHLVSRHGELETHVNRFHLKIKPYQCHYCTKSFCGKERLRDHLITHTTAKNCYCSVCNKKFENKTCLKLHMRRHTGYSPYACEMCGEKFRTSSMMNTHKIKKHSERSVACPLCESMFYLTREMRSHFKKVHWKQKGKKFDPRDVKELSPAFYHLFEDGRLPKVEGEDLNISSKCNEKFS